MEKPTPYAKFRWRHYCTLLASGSVLNLHVIKEVAPWPLSIVMDFVALSIIIVYGFITMRHTSHYYISPRADTVGGAMMFLAGCGAYVAIFALQGNMRLQALVLCSCSLTAVIWSAVMHWYVLQRETKALACAAMQRHEKIMKGS